MKMDVRVQVEKGLVVEQLSKSYQSRSGRVEILRDVCFAVEWGEFYTLLGPSGCGKTTTLRCAAGLERHDGGRILMAGQVVSEARSGAFVPPQNRDIGMVYQSYGIWPHMSVFENVAFPLQVAGGVRRAEVKRRVEESLAIVRLSGYEDRNASQLSGGQQQRLALARALVRRPKLLLLDEPLSNLDASLRSVMRTEIRDLQRQLGITTLYVTHDQTEALSMSTRIAIMRQGRIEQEGTPLDLYWRPATRFVAEFMGSTNFFAVRAISREADRTRVQTEIGPLAIDRPAPAASGSQLFATIRADNVRIHTDTRDRPENTFRARIESVTFLGDCVECSVQAGPARLVCRQPASLVFPEEGSEVWVELPGHLVTLVVG